MPKVHHPQSPTTGVHAARNEIEVDALWNPASAALLHVRNEELLRRAQHLAKERSAARS